MDPDSVEMPALELFTSVHNDQIISSFLNICKMHFTLTGILDENTKALLAKDRLSDTSRTWYGSQGYNETMVTFSTMKSHMIDYFIPSDYIRRARRVLLACKMG